MSFGFASLMNQFARRTYTVVVEGMEWGRAQKIYRRDLDMRVVSAAHTPTRRGC